jgi:LETM1 and EF-hand domain-containing protein 1
MPLYKDPESKAEKAVNLIKENIIPTVKTEEVKQQAAATAAGLDQKTKQIVQELNVDRKKMTEKPLAEEKSTSSDTTVATNEANAAVDVARPTLWQRIVKELKHYYDGFKLLGFETKIAYGLMKKVLAGNTLTRRERKQFTRTAADLFRLVPFSVFIIVPFMEFTLPIFLKLFPNMLPSTFQEHSKEQDALKKRLKAKLEMAKFLQDTLEETSLTSTGKSSNETSQKFADFMKKIRNKGEQPNNEEIMKYSSLFENELTLDNLTRQQLIALCQILDVSTLGNIPPNHILRFQLRMRIRNLEADDKVIVKEGLDTLTIDELQQACRDRGMRAIGVSETRLRKQLEQWLDLHLNRNIPLSLLILSRALYLPEHLAAEDIIKTTISALPKTIENATIAKIAEVTGAVIDNKTKLEVLKQEDAEIKLENAATKKEETVEPEPAARPEVVAKPAASEKDFAAEQLAKETLVDKAPVMTTATSAKKAKVDTEELTPVEIKEINKIIENLPSAEESQVKAEIAELKKDITEYKEDVAEVEELTKSTDKTVKLTETKSAKLLSKRVQKLLTDMDSLMGKIEAEKATGKLETT